MGTFLLVVVILLSAGGLGWALKAARVERALEQADRERIAAGLAWADTLAQLRFERDTALAEMAAAAVEQRRARDAALTLGAVADRIARDLRVSRDSLAALGATSVPVALLDSALALAGYREGERDRALEQVRAVQLQLQAAARLDAGRVREIVGERSRAERAEALVVALRGAANVSGGRGWGVGPTLALGVVTVASCVQRPLGVGCLAGAAVIASRL